MTPLWDPIGCDLNKFITGTQCRVLTRSARRWLAHWTATGLCPSFVLHSHARRCSNVALFSSVSVILARETKIILKSPRFVPFRTNLTQFGTDPDIPAPPHHLCQIWPLIWPVWNKKDTFDWDFASEPKWTDEWSLKVSDLSHLLTIWPTLKPHLRSVLVTSHWESWVKLSVLSCDYLPSLFHFVTLSCFIEVTFNPIQIVLFF